MCNAGGNNMTFLQLNYIIEIYNCGSINKAAKKLFLSQSSLCSSIRELEQELGIEIFNRSNKGIALTEDGKEFIMQIRPIVEQQKMVENYYADKNNCDFSSINISAQRYPFCAKAFVEFLKSENTSRYNFSYIEAEMDKVIENVSKRKSEIGIIFLSDMTEKFMNRVLAANDLEFHELTRVKPRAFININHPLSDKNSININDLLDYPYVAFSRNNNDSFNYSEEAILTEIGKFKRIIYVGDRASCYNILANTDCVSAGSGILPEGYGDNRLKSVPIEDANDFMRLGWIKIKDITISEQVEIYIDILKRIIEENI